MPQDNKMDSLDIIVVIIIAVASVAAVALLAYSYANLLQEFVKYCNQYICK